SGARARAPRGAAGPTAAPRAPAPASGGAPISATGVAGAGMAHAGERTSRNEFGMPRKRMKGSAAVRAIAYNDRDRGSRPRREPSMPSTPLPRAVLKAGREKSLRRRHPWVFSGAIERVDGEAAAGATIEVVDAAGRFLARAAYSPASQIRARVWTFASDETVDAAFLERRIERALDGRRRLGLLEPGTACRLVFGESDGLPGLVVDRYADWLVCQLLSAGMERWRGEIAAILERRLRPRG